MSYFTEYLRFSLQIFRMNDVSCHDTTDARLKFFLNLDSYDIDARILFHFS